MERCLRLLLSAAQRSKWGALLLILGVLGILALLVLGLVSVIGDLILMMTEAGPVMNFLGNGRGVLVLAVISIVFVLLGVAILWVLKPHAPQPEANAEPKLESAAPQPAPPETDSRQAQHNEPTAAYADMAIAQLAEDEFEGFKRNVFALGLAALSERSFQIERASIDKGRLVIVVEDVKGRLHLGDKLRVVDAEDFYPMGTFEVVRKRTEDCYAVGGKDVDGVWLTAVRNHREGDPVTYKIAILAERRAEQ